MSCHLFLEVAFLCNGLVSSALSPPRRDAHPTAAASAPCGNPSCLSAAAPRWHHWSSWFPCPPPTHSSQPWSKLTPSDHTKPLLSQENNNNNNKGLQSFSLIKRHRSVLTAPPGLSCRASSERSFCCEKCSSFLVGPVESKCSSESEPERHWLSFFFFFFVNLAKWEGVAMARNRQDKMGSEPLLAADFTSGEAGTGQVECAQLHEKLKKSVEFTWVPSSGSTQPSWVN